MTLRLACLLAPGPKTIEHARLAEALGYDRVWLSDSPALWQDIWARMALGRRAHPAPPARHGGAHSEPAPRRDAGRCDRHDRRTSRPAGSPSASRPALPADTRSATRSGCPGRT